MKFKSYYLTVFIVLLCLPAMAQTTIKTKYFQIQIDNKGYIHSMKNITKSPIREFSPTDKPSPILTLYNSKKKLYFYPQKASFSPAEKILTVNFDNGSNA